MAGGVLPRYKRRLAEDDVARVEHLTGASASSIMTKLIVTNLATEHHAPLTSPDAPKGIMHAGVEHPLSFAMISESAGIPDLGCDKTLSFVVISTGIVQAIKSNSNAVWKNLRLIAQISNGSCRAETFVITHAL